MTKQEANRKRFDANTTSGYYESYFLRANHPNRPLAFWFRYTIFCPKNQPERNLAEVWAILFDGEKQSHIAVKKEYPLSISSFADSSFQINIGENILNDSLLRGTISSGVNEVKWNLEYGGDEPPLAVLPEQWYEGGFPKAKLVVSLPLAVFNGTINVNGTRLEVKDWCGSQNHNWGPRHTDHYAWGQVAGFDSHPESFFEVATARMKMGQFWTPFLTLMVLRHNGREYRLNTAWPSLLAKASFGFFHWHFSSKANGVQIEGTIRAGKEAFSCLNYYNPPGGSKFCLNTKIASCSLKLTYADGTMEVLDTNHRAAFEILTDDASHGLTIAT